MDLVQTHNLSIWQESLRLATSRAKCRDDGIQNKMEKFASHIPKQMEWKMVDRMGEEAHLTLSNSGDTWLV